MTHASVKKCVFITTSCAILLSSTVELTGIPDGIGLCGTHICFDDSSQLFELMLRDTGILTHMDM